jgi:hypothetical protein
VRQVTTVGEIQTHQTIVSVEDGGVGHEVSRGAGESYATGQHLVSRDEGLI